MVQGEVVAVSGVVTLGEYTLRLVLYGLAMYAVAVVGLKVKNTPGLPISCARKALIVVAEAYLAAFLVVGLAGVYTVLAHPVVLTSILGGTVVASLVFLWKGVWSRECLGEWRQEYKLAAVTLFGLMLAVILCLLVYPALGVGWLTRPLQTPWSVGWW